MAGERTEQATPRRRQDARRDGQTGKSVDVTVAAGLLAALFIVQNAGGAFVTSIEAIIRQSFGGVAYREVTLPQLQAFGSSVGLQSALLVAPLMAGVIAVTLIAGFGQVGVMFSAKPLMPQFSRLSPANGLKRIFSLEGLFELGKSITKMLVVGAVGYMVIAENLPALARSIALPPDAAYGAVAALAFDLAIKCGFAYLALAAIDYLFQKRRFENSLKMSKEEVKQEMRQQEGNPEIKAKVKRIQRQYATGRMMAKVPNAAVVITNPTHYAVALSYDALSDSAPTVVAKGVDLIAQQIKRVAAENGVPCVENVPLARALYAGVDLDREIPAALYQAVAEVLAYIYKLRGRR